jgi:signal transduction histidine kinase
MRLFTRYNQINIISAIVIFILAGTAFYFLLQVVLTDQVDEDLQIEQREIENYLAKFGRLPDPIKLKDLQVIYLPLSAVKTTKPVFTTISNNRHHRDDQRKLNFPIAANGNWFDVQVTKSLESTDELTRSVAAITFITILVMLVTSLLINRIWLRVLWRPFYNSLGTMQLFKLGKTDLPQFGNTRVDEFNSLNEVLDAATKNATAEYQRLKNFTENASHELQTPLAIIRSKLDVLMQDEALTEQQSNLVQEVFDATLRMTKLNQALLLLSKIENHQFAETALVQLDELIEKKLLDFTELLQHQGFIITKDIHPAQVNMNATLAEIMLNNLFSNAIRHTRPNQTLAIAVNPQEFSIANSADAGPLDGQQLFNRFYKGKQSASENGLGLSIVAQIAEVSGFQVNYRFAENAHRFTIVFAPALFTRRVQPVG